MATGCGDSGRDCGAVGVVRMILNSDSVDRTKYHITVMVDKLKRCYKILGKTTNHQEGDVKLLVELIKALDEDTVLFTRYVEDVFGDF